MSEVHENRKVVLGGLSNLADAHAKKVLSSYKPNLRYETNLTNIQKCNARQLESCAELLRFKVRSEDGKEKLYKNQALLADRIIMRIESLFEANCSDCNETYHNALDATPLFICRLCMLGSHDCEVIKKKAEAMSAKAPVGYVWLCSICLSKNNLEDFEPPTKSAKKDSTKAKSASDSEPAIDTIVEEKGEEVEADTDLEEEDTENKEENTTRGKRHSPRRGRDSESDPSEPREDAPICELYKRRQCPHGKTGKKLVDGKFCEKKHPKRCFKYSNFGARDKRGCRKGKKCKYWHPRLCSGSLANKVCVNDECTFFHLEGTKRLDPDNDNRSYRRKEEQHHVPNNKPPQKAGNLKAPRFSTTSAFYTPYPPTVGKEGKSTAQTKSGRADDESTFLFKLIEEMKSGFQEQINELKESLHASQESQFQQQQFNNPVNRYYPPPPMMPNMMAHWYNQSYPPLSC